jgi:hypothetical protein
MGTYSVYATEVQLAGHDHHIYVELAIALHAAGWRDKGSGMRKIGPISFDESAALSTAWSSVRSSTAEQCCGRSLSVFIVAILHCMIQPAA